MTASAERSRPEGPFAPVWTSRRWLVCAALLWLGCTAVYFVTAPGRIDIIDGAIRYNVTESMIELGMPVVPNPMYTAVRGPDGQRYAFYQIGASAAAVPFVLLGRRLGHGSLESKQFAFSLTAVPFAGAIVALLFLIYGRMGLSLRQALNWSLVVAFCTLLWPYAGSTFDAVLQAFWLTLAMWAAIEALAGRSYRWACVSAAAFATLINVQEMYLVLGVSVLAGVPVTYGTVWNRLKLPTVQVIIAGLIAGLLLVFLYNALRFGNAIDTGRTSVPHPLVGNPLVGFAGLFISPAKSVFLYSPTFLLALFGLRRLLARAPDRFAPVAACLLIHVALISSLKFWAGEWAWGPRYLVATLPLACIGLPYAWPRGDRRRVTALLCGAGFMVQVLAISVDHQRYYVDHSFSPFFWLDESVMYKHSPLLERPSELVAVLEGSDTHGVRALVPGPRFQSMTSSIFGPPLELLQFFAKKDGTPATAPAWMRDYMVFLVPRPWPLWSGFIPEALRPGATGVMTLGGCLVAMASFAALAGLVRSVERRTGD